MALAILKGMMDMDPNAVEKLIEPVVVRYLRKVLTWILGLAAGFLVSKGIGVDPAKAPELAGAITTAIGVPLSSLLSKLFDAAVRKWWPGNVLPAKAQEPPK